MELEKAKKIALRFLNYRPRTVKEIEIHLKKKKFSQEIIEQVVEYLLNLSYLNDELFCELWIKDRIKLKPMGKKRIYYELEQKGIKGELIELSLEKYFSDDLEYSLAKELAEKKCERLNIEDISQKKKKIKDFLYRRGFNLYILDNIIDDVNNRC